MKNKVKNVFVKCLGVSADDIKDELTYKSIAQWDSVAHMSLITALEDEFDIMIEIDDVIDLNSVSKAYEIVSKYSKI